MCVPHHFKDKPGEGRLALTTVMIVDDDETTTSLLKMLLELDDFEVVVEQRGRNVIAKAEATSPALIMIDYHLSDIEGVDVVRDLRAHRTLSEIPIIVASGMDKEIEAKDAGANVFLVKPFEPADLPGLFNQLISS